MTERGVLDHAYLLAQDLATDLSDLHAGWCGNSFDPVSDHYFREHRIDFTLGHLARWAHDLVSSLDFTSAIECDSSLGGDIVLARDLGVELDQATRGARNLVRDLVRERPHGRDDRSDHAAARVFAGLLVRELCRLRNVAVVLAQSIACARGRTTDLDLVRQLDRVLGLFIVNDEISERLETNDLVDRAIAQTTMSALRLTVLATRVLPYGDRPRYSEEWRSELWMLCQDGASRHEQVRYGLRLLSRSVGLRLALLWQPAAKRERVR